MAVSDDVRATLVDAAQKMIEAGWQVDEVDCPPMRPAADVNARLWMAEMEHSAHDMVADEGDADAVFVYQQMRADAGEIDVDCLMKTLQLRATLVREWVVFHRTYPVLICPVSGELPFAQQLDVSSEAAIQRVYEAQLPQRALPTMGLPALAVATGKVGTIPVGVQLVAGRFREDILLAAGADIERAGSVPGVANPV
ncbi:amidase family protein [Marimonas arenosa]|uniref:Amidase family protein n=1 Tax=Marimonas arenosa TaxID=1795305 RepID=A0AAE3WDV9_9RHOB|nr:amidase family protein [Marimonas arenosa]